MPKNKSHCLLIACFLGGLFCALVPLETFAQTAPAIHFSTFESGEGPSLANGTYHLLDANNTPGQSNAVAFDVTQEGALEQLTLRGRVRVLEGGDGGSFIFLNTAEYGKRGPAPFVKSWVEPNLAKTFAVGIDVHNPPTDEKFGPDGNYQSKPEREVSLHWDGREIVKRVSPAEFRRDFAEFEISVKHVIGGAEVTVILAGKKVYDGYFLAGMHPYESRLAIGAGTRDDTTTEFDVQHLAFKRKIPAPRQRPAKHFSLFNHVMIGSEAAFHVKEVTLPPINWAFGRVILTLEIHDAGANWDKWDRNGYLYIVGPTGEKYDIAPFITSYQTPGRWEVDVTHFRPWLTGDVKIELAIQPPFDESNGFMMSASLDFYHGMPQLEPFRIVPIWHGTARYRSAENHFSDFFVSRIISIDPETEAAQLFTTTSGHSTVGEFTPSHRTMVFVPAQGKEPVTEHRFENTLWKDDCYLNPVRPQRGTWKYSRAGWAPGDVVRPWKINLTPYIVPGEKAELRYEPEAYNFSGRPREERPTDDEINRAVHLVRAYLILFRSPSELVSAPHLKVLSVKENSTASKGGILAGDYLTSYDGKQLSSIDEIREFIKVAKESGNNRISIVIYRGHTQIEKEIGPGRLGVTIEEQ